MFVISYFAGSERKGLLAFREGECGVEALGGFDPGEPPLPTLSMGPGNGLILTRFTLTTVVSTQNYDRILKGWVHPDQISETSGAEDGESVVVLNVKASRSGMY